MSASSPALSPYPEVVGPDVSAIVTEDDTPVDSIYSEKQQRFLTEALHSGWSGPPPEEAGAQRPFVAAANVGVFSTAHTPPLVPDVFVSLDVELHPDIWAKEHRTYFIWEFGKPPDVVIEVVSNREGDELGKRLKRYAEMRVPYYIVWDPGAFLGDVTLRAFELHGRAYVRMARPFFDDLGLRLVEWTGSFEGVECIWLRWADANGALLPTGAERAAQAQQRAEQAEQAHAKERTRAEQAEQAHAKERTRAEQAEQEIAALRAELERLRKG